MTRATLEVRVPGKLMLLGEYAVLDPGAPALVLAVDRSVRVRLEPAGELRLDCPDIGIEALGGRLTANGVQWNADDDAPDPAKLRFVDQTLSLVIALTRAAGREPAPFHMRVTSELGAGSAKAGLGSSASVAVAVAAAALRWCGFDVEGGVGRTLLFQVAAVAHHLAQGRRGSGADVAAAVAGGIVAYRNPGFEELLRDVSDRANDAAGAAAAIQERAWDQLRLDDIPWPAGHAFVSAATGVAASTTQLIDRVTRLDGRAADSFRRLKSELGELARRAIDEPTAASLGAAMRAHQQALERFDDANGGLGIVTPAIRALVGSAAELGVAAKISGAGGGDSVVALVPRERVAALTAAYGAAGAETFAVLEPVAGATVRAV